MYHRYRSIDGSCNNIVKGERGQSFTVYGRLLYPNYLGGIKEPRRSVTKQTLPSARLVSSVMQCDTIIDKKRSLAVRFWGQLVEHDMSHTAMSKMSECSIIHLKRNLRILIQIQVSSLAECFAFVSTRSFQFLSSSFIIP